MQRVLFTGITRGRWTGLILIWVTVGLLFVFLYRTAYEAVLQEIRSHVMGVAIATAAGITPEDIEAVNAPEDTAKPAFRRIQSHLDRISRMNPDIRYIYTMRRDRSPDAGPTDYRYVVDQPERDENDNGEIDPDEISEAPGNPYDASEFPEMLTAWTSPTADHEITPDPPYPDLISGYCPIKNDRGLTVAIVGVDMIAKTIRNKYLAIRAVNLIVGALLCILITLVVQLYYQQREALEANTLLSEELSSRNEMLRAANVELSRNNDRFESEIKLAEHVQRGFLPETFPRRDRLVFDKFYLTCDVLGGDLFDVFSDEEDSVALYMADVAGHGVSAALISGLLKMAVASVREKTWIAKGHLRADLLRPNEILATLNEMLVKEIPDYEFITMVYAVLDLSRDTFIISSAGHPPPVIYSAETRQARLWDMPTGAALGLIAEQSYPVVEYQVHSDDKVLFYTDGLTEAMNQERDEFGTERLLRVVQESGHLSPADVIAAIRDAVDAHRAGAAMSDDFSLLVSQLT